MGQLEGWEHFHNVERHKVIMDERILSLWVDAILYFPNVRFFDVTVNDAVAENPDIKHLILVCPAVNTIDLSALESLEAVNLRLKDNGITFHSVGGEGAGDGSTKRNTFPA